MLQKVRINKGMIGLVYRRGDYVRLLTEGSYWIRVSDNLIKYDLTHQFYPPIDLNVLLRNDELKEQLLIVDVNDNEIVLKYKDGNFSEVLKPGRYAFWKGVTDYKFITCDLSKAEITEDISRSVLYKLMLQGYTTVVSLEPSQRALLYINGEYKEVLTEGLYYFWKTSDVIQVRKADLRQLQLEISGQEILTKDKAALRVNFYLQYKIADIEKALNETKDYEKQLYILVQLALREFVGMYTLDEILEKKESVAAFVYDSVKEKAEKLGVKINGSGLRDIILPGDVKEIMNYVLIAQKRAQANIITRREETASTRSLLNTAKLMEENKMLFKLKEMEFVEKIAEKLDIVTLSGNDNMAEQLKRIFSSTD
jgi:hypothetical protein